MENTSIGTMWEYTVQLIYTHLKTGFIWGGDLQLLFGTEQDEETEVLSDDYRVVR